MIAATVFALISFITAMEYEFELEMVIRGYYIMGSKKKVTFKNCVRKHRTFSSMFVKKKLLSLLFYARCVLLSNRILNVGSHNYIITTLILCS